MEETSFVSKVKIRRRDLPDERKKNLFKEYDRKF